MNVRKNWKNEWRCLVALVVVGGVSASAMAQLPEVPTPTAGKVEGAATGQVESAVKATTKSTVDAGVTGKADAAAEGQLDAANQKLKLDADADGQLRGIAERDGTGFGTDSRGNLGAQFDGQNGGLTIRSMTQGSLAARAGLQSDDEIIAVNGARVSSQAELNEQLRAAGRADGRAQIIVIRDGRMQTLQTGEFVGFAGDGSAQGFDGPPSSPQIPQVRTFYRGPYNEAYSSDGYREASRYNSRRGWRSRCCR